MFKTLRFAGFSNRKAIFIYALRDVSTGNMLSVEKTAESKIKVTEEVSRIVSPALKETLNLLKERMAQLSKAEGIDRETVEFANRYALSGLPPGPRSRLEIDAYIRAEISGDSKKLQKAMDAVISDIVLISEARDLNAGELAGRIRRWGEGSKMQALEFRAAIERNKRSISDARTYNEVLGQAARLHNELHTIVTGLPEYLSSYASNDIRHD